MLLLLGGAPRAGKGVVSRLCAAELDVSVLSLDVLKMGLLHAVPSVGIELGTPPTEVGHRMWPLVRAMAVWALARLAPARAHACREPYLRNESDAGGRAEWAARDG